MSIVKYFTVDSIKVELLNIEKVKFGNINNMKVIDEIKANISLLVLILIDSIFATIPSYRASF